MDISFSNAAMETSDTHIEYLNIIYETAVLLFQEFIYQLTLFVKYNRVIKLDNSLIFQY